MKNKMFILGIALIFIYINSICIISYAGFNWAEIEAAGNEPVIIPPTPDDDYSQPTIPTPRSNSRGRTTSKFSYSY